jgi:signal transduction histidine kinase
MQTPPPRDSEQLPPAATVADLSVVIAHLQNSLELERVRLSRCLHDDLGGLLVSAVMDLGWLEQHHAAGELGERLARVRGSLASAIDLKRNLIEDLRPTLLDNFGLFAAYRWHVKHTCQRAGVACTEQYPDEELQLHPEALSGLFRTLQETLTVIFTEPSVQRIDVAVEVANDALVLQTGHTHEGREVTDVFARLPGQMGAITRRIDSFGGRFSVTRHATGSTFVARFPMHRILAAA